MNTFSLLSSLFLKLKKEYSKYIELQLNITTNKDKIEQSQRVIGCIINLIQKEIMNIKEQYLKRIELEQEKAKRNMYNNQLGQIQKILQKAVKTLTYKISFYNQYSSSSITLKDLINLSFRINKQDQFPLNLQNKSLPAAFLRPYPHEDLEIKNSLLKFDLSEEKRLKPPIVNPKEGTVKKGTLLTFTYKDDKEKDKHDIFFKYSLNPECIPSFCSGELYNDNSPIILDKNCEIKVCSCKIGFKDSIVYTLNYQVTSEEVNIERIKTKANINPEVVRRPELHIAQGGEKYEKVNISASEMNTPNGSSGGTGSVRNSQFDYSLSHDDEDDDVI